MEFYEEFLDQFYVNKIVEARFKPFDPPTLEEICKAIKGRFYVGIYYQETDLSVQSKVKSGFRLIEPLVLGQGYMGQNPNGQYLRAYVIKDSSEDPKMKIKRKSVSKTERDPYYRVFRIDRIKQWFRFNYKFSNPRDMYNPDDLCMDKILCTLQLDEFPKRRR